MCIDQSSRQGDEPSIGVLPKNEGKQSKEVPKQSSKDLPPGAAPAKYPDPPSTGRHVEAATPDPKMPAIFKRREPEPKNPNTRRRDANDPRGGDQDAKSPTKNPILLEEGDQMRSPSEKFAAQLPNAHDPKIDSNNEVWDRKPDGTWLHLGTIINGRFLARSDVPEASSSPGDALNIPAAPEIADALAKKNVYQGRDRHWYDTVTNQSMKDTDGTPMTTQQVMDAKGVLSEDRRRQLEEFGIKPGSDGSYFKNGALMRDLHGEALTLPLVLDREGLTDLPPPPLRESEANLQIAVADGARLHRGFPGIAKDLHFAWRDPSGYVFAFDQNGRITGLGQIKGEIFYLLLKRVCAE